ncbi:MAG: RNA polymerase sigma factor [Deltaproteobacteria bacterium]|nr:RNA polymerase sigma factor [Deltaproteobacteria bacterium]
MQGVSRRYVCSLPSARGETLSLEERKDEALMLAYRQGEAEAFNVLLRRHQRPIFNFLMRHLGDRTMAEDLLQEVFLRLIKGAASYKREAKFTTWLYTIARNLCIDNARRAKHRRAASLEQPIGKTDDGSRTLKDVVADKGPGVDRQVTSHRLQQRIVQAVDSLSDEQREVFLMREQLNIPFKEIAEIVGVSDNTVKSRMRYALEHLRKMLEDYRELAQAVNE